MDVKNGGGAVSQYLSPFPLLATFRSADSLRRRWRDGSLPREWAAAYPCIFGADDLRLALNQPEYHFYEWLSAVLIYHTSGQLSLVENYAFPSHRRKREVVKELCRHDPDTARIIFSHGHASDVQCPDLLVYRPDFSDWFFCEAKGPHDSLKPGPRMFFEELQQATGRQVLLVRFQRTPQSHPRHSRPGKAARRRREAGWGSRQELPIANFQLEIGERGGGFVYCGVHCPEGRVFGAGGGGSRGWAISEKPMTPPRIPSPSLPAKLRVSLPAGESQAQSESQPGTELWPQLCTLPGAMPGGKPGILRRSLPVGLPGVSSGSRLRL